MHRFSRIFLHYLIIVLTIFGFYGCDGDKKLEGNTEEVVVVTVPTFNQDSAYQYIQNQVDFGPRVPNTSSHRACRDFLVEELTSFGATVVEQEFQATAYDQTQLNLTNIIASFYPGQKRRILLAAHWDTRPFADKDTIDMSLPIDGANDGGSGVGVLLEIARQLQNNQPPNVGVDIILFDGEDYGIPVTDENNYPSVEYSGYCLGSSYWSENKHSPNYSAYYGILLDMVGAKDAVFYKEGVSMNFAPTIVKKVWGHGKSLGYDHHFVDKTSDQITDDHWFVNTKGKIPMIDVIEYNPGGKDYFGLYHHTHQDNMEVINKFTLKAVGQTVLHTIFYE